MRLAHAAECISNGRHKSYYLHLFVFVVPLMVAKYGNLWRFCTSSLEYRNARIKKQKLSWRNGFDTKGAVGAYDVCAAKEAVRLKQEHDGRLVEFKQKYKSCPVLQMLRNTSCVENLRARGEGVAGVRLMKMGRKTRYKLEPEGPANAVLGGLASDFIASVSESMS